MKYYVTADTHGYYTYLQQALEGVGFFEETEPHKLVVCGDLLDRGSEANQLIEFMIKLMKEEKLIYILGNHEELLVQCLQQIAGGGVYEIANGMSHHYLNKTWDTLLQIGKMDEMHAYKNPNKLVQRVMRSPFYKDLLSICVDYYETPHYVFTHGWIPCFTEGYRPYITYKYNPKWRNASTEAWQRARWFNGMELACKQHITEKEKVVVCGHWHTSYGHAIINHKCVEFGEGADFSPFYSDGIIALDSCAAESGKVNCIVIED